MEITEEILSERAEQTTPKPLAVRILLKAAVVLGLIFVFAFIISILFMGHTYSYHL